MICLIITATLFAYGQTNSGKTHTMFGSNGEDGISLLAVKRLFASMQERKERVYLIRCSYLEIYNEEIFDLLSSDKRTKRTMRHHKDEFKVVDAAEEIVTGYDDIAKLLERGGSTYSLSLSPLSLSIYIYIWVSWYFPSLLVLSFVYYSGRRLTYSYPQPSSDNRTFGVSNLNEHSSRSHVVFRVVIESAVRASEQQGGILKEKANLKSVGAVRVSEMVNSVNDSFCSSSSLLLVETLWLTYFYLFYTQPLWPIESCRPCWFGDTYLQLLRGSEGGIQSHQPLPHTT